MCDWRCVKYSKYGRAFHKAWNTIDNLFRESNSRRSAKPIVTWLPARDTSRTTELHFLPTRLGSARRGGSLWCANSVIYLFALRENEQKRQAGTTRVRLANDSARIRAT